MRIYPIPKCLPLNLVSFPLTASFSEDLGGVVNLVDKYGYDIDEGMIPRENAQSRL